VPWQRREYQPDDFDSSDPVNQALSAAHAALYGVVHAVIVSLGCSPGLGFVHTGHERSFVYDMADLYKADVTIPVAFDVISEGMEDITGTTRRRVRDRVFEFKVIERCVRDIQRLLEVDESEDLSVNVVSLWDYQRKIVAGGTNHAFAMEASEGGDPPWSSSSCRRHPQDCAGPSHDGCSRCPQGCTSGTSPRGCESRSGN